MSPTTLGTRCSRSVSLKALFSLAVLVLVAIEIPTAMAGTEGDTAAALKWEPVDPGFARYGAAGAFIPKSGALIVFGGAGPNGLRDSGLLVLDTRNRRMTLQMPPGNSPPQRQGLSAVYDPAGDRVIVFGGADYHTGFNDVWALSVTPKIEWSRLNPAGDLPAPRSWHAATIDTGRHRLIIFGGIADSGALLNDAWSLSLDGTPEWTRVDAKESAYPSALGNKLPEPRGYATAVYDTKRDRMIVLGGGKDDLSQYGVWALSFGDSPTWESVGAIDLHWGKEPFARFGHSALYDAALDRIVIFGGYARKEQGKRADEANDVWALYLSAGPQWKALQPANHPPTARTYHTAAYDVDGNRMIVFGGMGESIMQDAWQFSLGEDLRWTQLEIAGGAPVPRGGATAIYDTKRDRLVVFGGSTFLGETYFNDVCAFAFDGSNSWMTLGSADHGPSPRAWDTAVYDQARDRMIVFGGGRAMTVPFDSKVWAFSFGQAGGWSQIATVGAAPSGRHDHIAVIDPVGNRMVIFGGRDGAGRRLMDVWSLSLSQKPAWSELKPPISPPQGIASAGTYDSKRRRMIVVGTFSNSSQVWALSLADPPQWELLALGPGLTKVIRAAYDSKRDVVCCLGDDWQDNITVQTLSLGSPGGGWQTVDVANRPHGSAWSRAMIYDPVRDRLVVFGSYYGAEDSGNTVSFLSLP